MELYLECASLMLLGLLQSEVFNHRMIQCPPVIAGQAENPPFQRVRPWVFMLLL